MSPEAQRIRLAEACGWKRSEAGFSNPLIMVRPGTIRHAFPPDYLNDLNAVHAVAREWVTKNQKSPWTLSRNLEETVTRDWENGDPDSSVVCFYLATAKQWTEALLKTLNLWNDDE